MYLPEVLQSAGAMKASLAILKPLLALRDQNRGGKILIGTVKGDMHDIGKNLVSIMLQGAGFEIVDIGLQRGSSEICMAIANTPGDRRTIGNVDNDDAEYENDDRCHCGAGLRSKVKIIIGGAPVSQKFADEIGADGYSRDAVLAVDKVKQFMDRTS